MLDLEISSTLQARILAYGLVLTGGALLGLLFYGGLWWSVQRSMHARFPGLLTLASFWVRTAATLLGFYLLMDGRAGRLLAALAGFVLIRIVLAHRLGPARESAREPAREPIRKEGVHADHVG